MLYLQILSLTQSHIFICILSCSLFASHVSSPIFANMSPTLSHLPTFIDHMQFHWYSSHSLLANLLPLTAAIANYSNYVFSSLCQLCMQPCEAFKSCYCVYVIVFILPISVCVFHMCCTVLLCQQFLINLFMQWQIQGERALAIAPLEPYIIGDKKNGCTDNMNSKTPNTL